MPVEIRPETKIGYRRLIVLMLFRLVFAICVGGAITIWQLQYKEIPPVYLYVYYILIFVFVLSLLYGVMLRLKFNYQLLSWLQITMDVIITSLLVYFTGIDSPIKFLYFACVLSSAFLISSTAPYYFWSISSIMLSGISLLHYFHAAFRLPLPLLEKEVTLGYLRELPILFLLPYLFFFCLCLFAVAFLSDLLVKETSKVKIFSKEILQNMADGVITVDNKGRIIFANRQAAESIPIPLDVEGQQYSKILPQSLSGFVERTLQNYEEVEGEIMLSGKYLDLRVTPVFSKKRNLKGAVVLVRDITPQKEAETLKRIGERFSALVRMSASMAHEIRNPLAAIRASAQEILKGAADSQENKKLFSILIKEIDRLDKIATSFFEFAQDKPLELTKCDISKLLGETIDIVTPQANSRDIQIKKEIQPNMEIYCSADKIKQVFLNILTNAIQAIERAGQIIVRCYPMKSADLTQDDVFIEFEDNGCGIPSENIDEIFEPFFSTKKDGIGLGLAIAKKIVELHKGKIYVFSKLNKGTKFVIHLPRI